MFGISYVEQFTEDEFCCIKKIVSISFNNVVIILEKYYGVKLDISELSLNTLNTSIQSKTFMKKYTNQNLVIIDELR